jgi:4-amino-4-deoxy-L-arabinose transferase-like glycosyltransferase
MEDRLQQFARAATAPFASDRLSPRGICLVLGLLTLLAFALRVGFTEAFDGGLARPYTEDEPTYVNVARRVLAGEGYTRPNEPTSMRTPGLPLLAGGVIAICGDSVVCMRLTMCFIAALIVPAIYLAGRAIVDARTGFLAALVGAVYPPWLYQSGAVLTDLPAAVLGCLVVWLLVRGWKRDSLPLLAGAGMIAGFTTLVRPTAIAFFVAGFAWLLIVMKTWRRGLSSALVLLVGFSLLIAPWCVRNYYAHGRFVFISSKSGSELWKSTNPYATGINSLDAFEDKRIFFLDDSVSEADADRIYKAAALKFIRENPGRFVELAGIKFVQFWKVWSPRVTLLPNLVTLFCFGPVLVLFLVGIFKFGLRRGPELLPLMVIMGFTVLHMVFTSMVRYRLPIEPLCLILALEVAVPLVERHLQPASAPRLDSEPLGQLSH